MQESIALLLPFEIYIWLICGLISLWGILINLYIIGKRLIPKRAIPPTPVIPAQEDIAQEITTQEIIIDNTELVDIAQKLLQQIAIESEGTVEIVNKLEIIERESNNNNDISLNEITISIDQTSITHEEPEVKKELNNYNSSPLVQPEIYNTNTNLETVNKQKSQFEVLKHEVETLKARNNGVEYEKKLVQATMEFPDDPHFNTLLGDYYIENNDFKKAQTIYKKLHLQNESDDKALFKLGLIHLELGDLSSAEFLLTKAKNLKPENPKYYQLLAEAKYNLEKIDESIELMEKAVDLRPTKFEYIEILGKLYKETDNIQLYYKTLLKMNALEPLNQRVRGELNKFQE